MSQSNVTAFLLAESSMTTCEKYEERRCDAIVVNLGGVTGEEAHSMKLWGGKSRCDFRKPTRHSSFEKDGNRVVMRNTANINGIIGY
jgi:hypothetical protein